MEMVEWGQAKDVGAPNYLLKPFATLLTKECHSDIKTGGSASLLLFGEEHLGHFRGCLQRAKLQGQVALLSECEHAVYLMLLSVKAARVQDVRLSAARLSLKGH
jgi:hypothetical protein